MTKLNIRADQVCVGDIFSDGDVVEDFEFFNYPTRKTIEIYVTDVNGESHSKEFDQDAMVTVDTDYLDRIFDQWDAEDDNEDAQAEGTDSDEEYRTFTLPETEEDMKELFER